MGYQSHHGDGSEEYLLNGESEPTEPLNWKGSFFVNLFKTPLRFLDICYRLWTYEGSYRTDKTGNGLRLIQSFFEGLEFIDLLMDFLLLGRIFVARFTWEFTDEASEISLIILWRLVIFHFIFMLLHNFFRFAIYANHITDIRFFVWGLNFWAIWDPKNKYMELLQNDKVMNSYSIVARMLEDFPQTIISIVFLIYRQGDFASWFMTIYFGLQFTYLTVNHLINFEFALTMKAFMRRKVHDVDADALTEAEWLRENAPPNKLFFVFLAIFSFSRVVLFLNCIALQPTAGVSTVVLSIISIIDIFFFLLSLFMYNWKPTQSALLDGIFAKLTKWFDGAVIYPAVRKQTPVFVRPVRDEFGLPVNPLQLNDPNSPAALRSAAASKYATSIKNNNNNNNNNSNNHGGAGGGFNSSDGNRRAQQGARVDLATGRASAVYGGAGGGYHSTEHS